MSGPRDVVVGISVAVDGRYGNSGSMEVNCGVTGIIVLNAIDIITGALNASDRAVMIVNFGIPSLEL